MAETLEIKAEGSLPGAKLFTYIQDSSETMMRKEQPLVLICPGGGYTHISDREAEPLAVRFLAMGYHAAVLRYSVTPAIHPTWLLELAEAMKLIRKHADEWHVKPDRIFVLGCSAGGYLAASLGMFWHEKWLAEKAGAANEILKPAGMILCYPVITSGAYMDREFFQLLLNGQDTEEKIEALSLEKHVTEKAPEAFIWHTFTDTRVPVENSLLLVWEMRKKKVPVEFHLYPKGKHGLAAADEITQNSNGSGIQKECQSWLPLVQTWLREREG